MRDPRVIFITGASSGIGEALALSYAGKGIRLLLTGRDAGRLAQVAERCREKGADLVTTTIDVTDRAALAAWIMARDGEVPIDLVIANAGISAGTGGGVETEAQARAIFATNLDGVLNTIHPLIPTMVARGRGQIALMSSLASFRGMAGAAAYCGSKAAVRVYGEALRGDLARQGVGVSVICPGFVVSRMTAVNRFPMPFLMDADRAAGIVRRGLAAGKGRVAFPFPTYAVSWLLGVLPPGLVDMVLARAPRKG
ncbi:SDR family oxidoreductase [Niveispirillum sp.]|uniref:SDR family NAD(P)-dependent oxidoreductase n=1 Tax=Niveispirillum sp. TaxID=1917217 RepID=UPI001B6FA313|nr:SDR family NAD(P)-dependent oxidoreductase [Niveispirillum sp.]MBP7338380.1 SDR family NAD(P)-dependent oxidoreductase [Niveispirillum sp.]